MKSLNFEQMEQVSGGSESESGDGFASFMCNSATGAIGAIYGAGMGTAIGGPLGLWQVAFLACYGEPV